jgi:hypothetical protein
MPWPILRLPSDAHDNASALLLKITEGASPPMVTGGL